MYFDKIFPRRVVSSRWHTSVKKKDPNNKVNYRPINLLPIILKIFEGVSFPKKSYQQNCVVLEKAILNNMPFKSTEKTTKKL